MKSHTLELVELRRKKEPVQTGDGILVVSEKIIEHPIAEVQSREQLLDVLQEHDIDPADFENYRVKEKKTRKSFVSEVIEGVERWNASTA